MFELSDFELEHHTGKIKPAPIKGLPICWREYPNHLALNERFGMNTEQFLKEKFTDVLQDLSPGEESIWADLIEIGIEFLLERIRNCESKNAAVATMREGGIVARWTARKVAEDMKLPLGKRGKFARMLADKGRELSEEEAQAIANEAGKLPVPQPGGAFPRWAGVVAILLTFLAFGTVNAQAWPTVQETLPVNTMPSYGAWPEVQTDLLQNEPKVASYTLENEPPNLSIPATRAWSYNGGNHTPEQLRQHLLTHPNHVKLRDDYVKGLDTMQELKQLHSAHHEHLRRGNVLASTWFEKPGVVKAQPVANTSKQSTGRWVTESYGLLGRRTRKVWKPNANSSQTYQYNYSSGCPNGMCPR